jgi:hypothetical protein
MWDEEIAASRGDSAEPPISAGKKYRLHCANVVPVQ